MRSLSCTLVMLACMAFASLANCLLAETPPPSLPAALMETARKNRVPAFGGVYTFEAGGERFFSLRDEPKNNIHKDSKKRELLFEGKAGSEPELLMFTKAGWKLVTTQAEIDQAVAARSHVFILFAPEEFFIFDLPAQQYYFFQRYPAQR